MKRVLCLAFALVFQLDCETNIGRALSDLESDIDQLRAGLGTDAGR